MAFRSMGGGGNRRNDNNRNGGGGYGGYGSSGMNRPSPWGGDNSSGGNFRQGGGGGGMNNEVLSLANSLVNNLLRNQPPSLLDLPNRGGGYGGGRDNYGRFDDRMNRGNRNVVGANRRNGPPGARNKPDKLGAIKGGIRKRNAVSSAKKVLAKNSKDPKQQTEESSKKSKQESKYADVPNVMFYCHMCKKHMWDASSFENHVKGRTHLMMKDGVEESYRLRANMIRQEAKIEEQLKTIELERLKRMGKSAKGNNRREYCTMCDLHFFGHLSSHRKTDGHLQLKKFLHPRCGECAQEFPNRIDFDTHLLMPEHMKKSFATRSSRPERRKNALVIYTEEDELKDLKEEKEKEKPEKGAKKDNVAGEAGGNVDGDVAMEDDADAAGGGVGGGTAEAVDESMAENGEKIEGEEDGAGGADGIEKIDGEKSVVEPAPEPEDVILDYADGDEVPIEVENKIPKYNCARPIGFSLIHKLDCYECHLCGRFFDTERTSEIHTRTVTHHRNFVKFLNEKANDTKIAQKRAAAALEESERKKRKLEAALNGDSLKKEPGTGEGGDDEDGGDNAGEDEKKEDGDESYDPSEATGEDDTSKKDGDETMDSQDGDESFEDANATISKDEQTTPAVAAPPAAVPTPVTPVVEAIKEEEPPKPTPSPAAVSTPTRATPNARNRGRGRGGRR